MIAHDWPCVIRMGCAEIKCRESIDAVVEVAEGAAAVDEARETEAGATTEHVAVSFVAGSAAAKATAVAEQRRR